MNALTKFFGQGTLAFKGIEPRFALGLLGLVALLLVVAWWLQVGEARRRIKLPAACLRLFAAALIVLALMEPVLQSQELIPQQSFLVHLFDTSESMKIADYNRRTRASALEEKTGRDQSPRIKLDKLFRTLEFAFDDGLRSREPSEKIEPRQKPTDLVTSLRSLQLQTSGLPVSGIVLYSDGNATVNENRKDILEAAAQLHIPIYAVGSAPQKPGADFWIDKVIHPDEVANAVATKVTVMAGARGMKGASADIILSDGVKEIERQTFYPDNDEQSLRGEFSIQPTSLGLSHYQARIVSKAPESYPWNNEQDFFLRVRKDKRRILYVEGYPRYEYRFLRAAFEDDDRFRVTSMIWVTNQGQIYRQGLESAAELQGGFPQTEAELFAYDVVVLGDVAASSLNEQQLSAMREFVRKRGGGLLLLAGESSFARGGFENSPLADVLPFQFGAAPKLTRPFRVIPTAEGIERGMFGPYDPKRGGQGPWEILPPLNGLYPLAGLKPGARTLCEVDMGSGPGNLPVVIYQRYGQGTSLICGIPATWPWKFQTQSDNPSYPAFWKEMMLILLEQARGQIYVEANPPITSLGSEITIQGSVLDKEFKLDPTARVELKIETPDKKVLDLSPRSDPTGRVSFQATHKPAVAGTYKVLAQATPAQGGKLLSCDSMFVVQNQPPELREIRLNEGLLRELATTTGGEYIHLADYDKLPDLVKTKENAARGETKEKPVWDKATIYWAILGALLLEWLIRRLGNMA